MQRTAHGLQPIYTLDCRIHEWGPAEFRVNDVPLAVCGGTYPRERTENINEHLINGDNILSMTIQCPADAVGTTVPARHRWARAMAEVRLTRCTFGGRPEVDGEIIAIDRWLLPRTTDGEVLVETQVVRKAVTLGQYGLPGRPWDWEAAAQITLTDEDRQSLFQFLKRLHSALSQGDADPFVQASLTRLRDLEAAYPGFDAVERINLIRRMTRQQSTERWWGMQPLSEADFVPIVCGDGRLIACVNTAGQPALRELPDDDGEVSEYPIFVARLEGDWCIVR